MSTTIRKILAALLLCVALISLGLYLFNFVFEKHEIHDEARQESFVHDEANNDVISNFFDWTQEDNDRDRAVRKIVLIVVGVSSASLGLVALLKRRKDLTLTDTNSFLNMRPLIYSFKTIGVLRHSTRFGGGCLLLFLSKDPCRFHVWNPGTIACCFKNTPIIYRKTGNCQSA